jgi:hypothetical protein
MVGLTVLRAGATVGDWNAATRAAANIVDLDQCHCPAMIHRIVNVPFAGAFLLLLSGQSQAHISWFSYGKLESHAQQYRHQ